MNYIDKQIEPKHKRKRHSPSSKEISQKTNNSGKCLILIVKVSWKYLLPSTFRKSMVYTAELELTINNYMNDSKKKCKDLFWQQTPSTHQKKFVVVLLLPWGTFWNTLRLSPSYPCCNICCKSSTKILELKHAESR